MLYQNILSVIGQTPIVRINKLNPYPGVEIYAKLEMFNPSGSIKDRMAGYMVERAERRGLLRFGMTIVEATTGNTGIALAMVSAVKGYRLVAVMPENMSPARQQMMRAYGATVVMTPASQGPAGAIRYRDGLAQSTKDIWVPDQFSNQDNATAQEATGREILRQLHRPIGAFVAGIGTGGTLMGIGKTMKNANPQTLIVAVEPAESAVLGGSKPGQHDIQGIGEGFVPALADRKTFDRIEKVSTEEAKKMAGRLAREEGILAGTSSGANLAAAIRIASRLKQGDKAVTIFPDSGDRYLSQL